MQGPNDRKRPFCSGLSTALLDGTLDIDVRNEMRSRKGGGRGGAKHIKKVRNVLNRVRLMSSLNALSPDVCDSYSSSSEDDESYVDNDVAKEERTIVTRRGKKAMKLEEKEKAKDGNPPNHEYTVYPLKIWLLLAEYIDPEDVNTFSLLCKDTLSVVNTAHFWIRMFKRYHSRSVALPKCISLQRLLVKEGLKQRVVRALYYMYPPFVSKIVDKPRPLKSVTGFICLRHWVQSCSLKDFDEGNKWTYNFKLCKADINELFNPKTLPTGINLNRERDCVMLQIVWKDYLLLPTLVGKKLEKFLFSRNSVAMWFIDPHSTPDTCLGSLSLRLDVTQRPRILPWWHPAYWEHYACCNS